MKLKVPHYRQTTHYTCGSAVALMLLKYYRKKVKLDRNWEFHFWSKLAAIPFRFTPSISLARKLAKYGLKVELITIDNKDMKSELELAVKFEGSGKGESHYGYYKFYKNLLFKKAKKLGVKIKPRDLRLSDIEISLNKKRPVALLCDSYYLDKISGREPEHIPHWIIITGFNRNNLYVNDPHNGKLKFPKRDFEKLINTEKMGFPRALILSRG